MRSGGPWFWWLNLGPWLLYLAASLALMGTSYGLTSGVVLLGGMLALGLYLASAALRWLALRQGWLGLEGWKLVARLVAGVLGGALAQQLAVALVMVPVVTLGVVRMPGGHMMDYHPAAALAYWFNSALMLGLWAAGWLGWRGLQRARDNEMARLRAEAQRHALERDALRARLNPHFVFNALNNLRALINEDTERAREMVTRLSSTLRHALEQNDREWVRLGEELAVVEDYLAIEAVHYEQRLRVHTQVDPGALDARLPPMALQLLVENAIRHGIAVMPGGGELALDARCRDGTLRVEVSNPGRLGAGSGGHGVGLAYLRAHLGRDGRLELAEHEGRVLARLEIAQ